MNFGGYNEDRSEHMEHREIRSSTNHSFETFGCVGYFVSSSSSFSFAFFIWVQIVKSNFSLANFWQQSITATYSFISYSSFFIVMSCYAFFIAQNVSGCIVESNTNRELLWNDRFWCVERCTLQSHINTRKCVYWNYGILWRYTVRNILIQLNGGLVKCQG